MAFQRVVAGIGCAWLIGLGGLQFGCRTVTQADGAVVQQQADGAVVGVVLNLGTPDAGAPMDAAVMPIPDYHKGVLGPGVSATDITRFDTAKPAAGCNAPKIDYPLQSAVMPRNVFPPKIMWTYSAQASDIYRVRLMRPNATLEGYFVGSTTSWQPSLDLFSPVANRNVGQDIELTVTALTSGGLCEGKLTFKTVDAYIAGSVYYWSPPLAGVKRVDVDKGQLVNFMPNPGGCLACHGVTRDGYRMAATMGDPSVIAFDLTKDLTGNPPPSIYKLGNGDPNCADWRCGETMSVFNADGSRLLINFEGGGVFNLLDGLTGQLVKLDVVAGGGEEPEWSPDNSAIAYSKLTPGNLAVVDALPGDTFGTPKVIIPSSTDWHPTWTPDSKWLAFERGNTCLVKGGSTTNGEIWMTSRTGTGTVRLDKLNGGRTDNCIPIFSPFDSGGYFWVLYSTYRPYGNAKDGVTGVRQIWIAAVHDKPGTFPDPSEVPYYMDGQEPATNQRPFWAPSPCQRYAGACETDGQCCSGKCVSGKCEAPVVCHNRGETCATAADCCSGTGLSCIGNLCDFPAIQ